jgi:phosphoribosylanthranilate isomerase
MGVKLKICGVTNMEDAKALDALGVDFIGVVTDPISPRYVERHLVKELKRSIETPIVEVLVSSPLSEVNTSIADYVQIHRVLSDEELNEISTMSKRIILYVPALREAVHYLLKAQRFTDLILFDAPRKGLKADPNILKTLLDYHPDAGVGGGITLENVYDYLVLEPGWLDVSSGVEVYVGKKDMAKVRKLKEVVTLWRRRA